MKIKKWVPTILIITCSFAVLIWYLGVGGLIAGVFETLFLLAITNPDRTMQYLASFYTVGRKFSFWFERNKVEKYLEGTISLCSKRVNDEGVNLLPHGVDIKWVEPKERDAFLKDNKVVVCLEPSYNESRNLARATLLYVAEDLIRESQRFVNVVVMKSLNFAVARKMLMLDRKLNALKCLNEEFVEPEAIRAPKIRQYVSAMEKTDEQGHLTRVLLREFSELGAKLSPALSDPRATKETESFTLLLKTFEEREREEDVPLRHKGEIIRASLMPVARLGTDFDVSRYVKRASQNFKDGIVKLYVLARGMNIVLAKPVIEEIEKAQLYTKVREGKFKIIGQKGEIDSYVAVLSRVGS